MKKTKITGLLILLAVSMAYVVLWFAKFRAEYAATYESTYMLIYFLGAKPLALFSAGGLLGMALSRFSNKKLPFRSKILLQVLVGICLLTYLLGAYLMVCGGIPWLAPLAKLTYRIVGYVPAVFAILGFCLILEGELLHKDTFDY